MVHFVFLEACQGGPCGSLRNPFVWQRNPGWNGRYSSSNCSALVSTTKFLCGGRAVPRVPPTLAYNNSLSENRSSDMLPIWLVTSLPTWLVAFLVLYATATLYVAIRFREVRKFLAGAFFVSSGILWYLWATSISLPIVLPYAGAISVETPEISGQRAIVHFILFLLCLYFGFFSKRKDNPAEA